MQLRELIELAAKKSGNQNDLAKVIGVSADVLTHAKAGRRGLPAIACAKLAEVLGVDRWAVIAASELVTEKNEEKRAYLSPFVFNSLTGLIAAGALLLTAPQESYANDTLNVSAGEEAPVKSSTYDAAKLQCTNYAN